ncbi:hypothetical protein [Kitasatospora sp. NPDC093102]|uniref:hypothetical protein n=1 Tax=Kitasatospora sp. NPDC093102 TaxID=3155069 RepID=UPI00341D8992
MDERDPRGRRDRTLQIMRTDSGRAWHASEIAKELGLPSHRGLSAELGRWVKEGMLLKPAPVTYILAPEWLAPDQQEPSPEADLTAAPAR